LQIGGQKGGARFQGLKAVWRAKKMPRRASAAKSCREPRPNPSGLSAKAGAF
jgi:hypothetical protein